MPLSLLHGGGVLAQFTVNLTVNNTPSFLIEKIATGEI
jgi:hypothetical protein